MPISERDLVLLDQLNKFNHDGTFPAKLSALSDKSLRSLMGMLTEHLNKDSPSLEVMMLMHALECELDKRCTPAPTPENDPVWKKIQEVIGKAPDHTQEHTPKRRRKRTGIRWVAAVAAVFTMVTSLSVFTYAGGTIFYDFLFKIGQTLQLEIRMETVTEWDDTSMILPKDRVYFNLRDFRKDAPTFPYPEGMPVELTKFSGKVSTKMENRISYFYMWSNQDDSKRINININRYLSSKSYPISFLEIDGDIYERYWANGLDFYIISNCGSLVMLWKDQKSYCQLYSNCSTIEEMKAFADEIHGGIFE